MQRRSGSHSYTAAGFCRLTVIVDKEQASADRMDLCRTKDDWQQSP